MWLLVLLLIASAIYSGGETGYLTLASFKRFDRKKLALILTSLLVGVNFANVLLTSLATEQARFLWKNPSLYVSLILTPVVLVFGEILPKTVFRYRAESLVKVFEPFYTFSHFVYFPVSWLVFNLAEALGILFRKVKVKPVSLDEVEKITREFAGSDATFLFFYLLDLLHRPADAICLPLSKMPLISENSNFEELLKLIEQENRPAVPVFRNRIHNIVGVVDLYKVSSAVKKNAKIDIKSVMSRPVFVPSSVRVLELISTFLKSEAELALVVDEHGDVIGGVYRNDVLQFALPLKKEKMKFVSVPDGWIVSGSTPVAVLRSAGLKIPVSPDYTTVAGFILNFLKRIPKKGELFEICGYKFQILDVDARSIRKVKICKE